MSRPTSNRRLFGLTAVGAIGGLAVMLPNSALLGEVAAGPLAQATATSPQPTPVSPQPVPTKREVRFYPVDNIFRPYYERLDGFRVMGRAISPLAQSGGRTAQYFEKARLEDFRAQETRPEYQYLYGLLVDEMKAVRSLAPVGGDASSVTYSTLQDESEDFRRIAPPSNSSGIQLRADGTAFVPFSADLSASPGHNVPSYFWQYINDISLFPGGWLHDIGLPTTEPLSALVDKGMFEGDRVIPVRGRPITVQAFQRTILTYDPANPAGYLVERANTGTDYMSVFPDRVPT